MNALLSNQVALSFSPLPPVGTAVMYRLLADVVAALVVVVASVLLARLLPAEFLSAHAALVLFGTLLRPVLPFQVPAALLAARRAVAAGGGA